MDNNEEINSISPVDNSTSGTLEAEGCVSNRISGVYEQNVGALKTVTAESLSSLPEGFNLNDKYLDVFAGENRILVNLSELRDVYTAGNGISILNRVISNTKVTEWGDITGSLNDQNDLKNALDTILANADYNNYVPKTQTAGLLQKGIVNLDTVNQSKGLLTGNISDEPEVLKNITNYAHSTFDRSKFTVAGSPVITDDGIASGFSTGNYITASGGLLGDGDWEIIVPYTTPSDISSLSSANGNCIFSSTVANEISLRFYGANLYSSITDTNGANIWSGNPSVAVTAGTSYLFKVSHKSGKYYYDYSTDNGATWTNVKNETNANLIKNYNSAKSFCFGIYKTDTTPISIGSIDFKQFSITVDGVPVFSGNKTGIDTIKPDDYTTTATPPTITPDRIVSGFSSAKSINSPLVLAPKLGFRIKQKFTLGTNISTNQTAFGLSRSGTDRFIFDLRIISGNEAYLIYSTGETSHATLSWTQTELPRAAGGSYDVDIITNGTEITAKINGVEKSANNFFIATSNYVRLGAGTNGSGDNPFLGSIDLNAFKIHIDGDLVYQPCLKIPYTESKTGSKIVNSIYRDRVNDMAGQFGFAPYYTLSDTDFTLPKGEIYGMIGRLQRLSDNEIGLPFPTLSDTLNENEIWLEGAEVSKTAYSRLYAIYGNNFGVSSDNKKFVLPDFRNRVMWGVGTFLENSVFTPYISAGLPNITGQAENTGDGKGFENTCGAFDGEYVSASPLATGGGTYTLSKKLKFDASGSNSVYGNSSTVQPPAIKVRVKTRYR